MNLVNLTPFPAALTLATDKHGREHIVTVTKGTFEVTPDGRCEIAGRLEGLVRADEFHGVPGESSVQYESDFAMRKPRTDVVLNGHAHAPGGRQVTSIDVTLELGSIRKTARVFGDRVWQRSMLRGFRPSDPAPFQKVPLTWERAFGGADTSDEDPKKHVYELRNLVGIGLYARVRDAIAGTAVPNLESPQEPIREVGDRPEPVGFGFVARNWQPRARYAGTYDDVWLARRFPFLPEDFDELYFQGAPLDQTCDLLRGGEAVRLRGVTPAGSLEFRLPSVRVPVGIVRRREFESVESVLDTVVLEPDVPRCLLTWRSTLPLPCKPTSIREIWVGEPTPGRTRARETGKRYIERYGWPS